MNLCFKQLNPPLVFSVFKLLKSCSLFHTSFRNYACLSFSVKMEFTKSGVINPAPLATADKKNTKKRKNQKANKSKKKENNRPRWTHFVSIPLGHNINVEAFSNFKSSVLLSFNDTNTNSDDESKGCGTCIDESVFISQHKLHFTLFLLSLPDEESLEKARVVLKEQAQNHMSFPLSCQGLSCFPSAKKSQKARVLFTEPSPDSLPHIKDLSKRLLLAFKDSGLLHDAEFKRNYNTEMEEVTSNFHATLMNIKYKKVPKGAKKVYSMDVSQILEDHASDFVFETLSVTNIHLSALTKPPMANGYYHCEVDAGLVDTQTEGNKNALDYT